MPSYATQLARGRGKYRYRLEVQGWPHIFVSDRSLVRTLADGRRQILGLLPESIRIAARADLWRAGLREQEMTVELGDVRQDESGAAIRHSLTRALHRSPSATTYLTADLTTSATTVTVASTAAFPSSGVVHLRTEAIAYSGKTATSFTGCTRGIWGTVAQAHTIGTGDRRFYPRVTDLPTALMGRRTWLYMYGSGDSSTGDGTLRWRGVASTDVSDEGLVYRFGVEPRSRVLEQQLGADLEEAVPLRGIYLPTDGAIVFRVQRMPAASWVSGATPAEFFDVKLSGFFADNVAVCQQLQTQIDSGVASWTWGAGASLTVEPNGVTGYRFKYRTDASTPHFVAIIGSELHRIPRPSPSAPQTFGVSPVDLFVGAPGGQGASGRWLDSAGLVATTLAAGREYTIEIDAPVPRASLERFASRGLGVTNDGAGGWPRGRLYLGGGVVPTASSIVAVRPDGTEGESEPWTTPLAVSASDRWVQVDHPAERFGPQTRVRLIRELARGHVGDLIDAVIADAPTLANAGASPLVTADDWDADWTEVENAIADLGLGADRVFVATEGASFGELLEEELKLIGCYLALDATGKLKIKRLGLTVDTAAVSQALTSSTTKGGLPATTRSSQGMVSEVLIRTGYDPLEDEHKGITVRVRNVSGPSHLAGVLEVAPKSKTGGALYASTDPVDVDPEQAYQLASAVIGLFGEAYSTVSLSVGLEHFAAELGDAVLLTSPHVPSADGTRGVVNRVALLVGYDWSPGEGRGTFELLTHDRRVAGYAPGFVVASQANEGGNVWALTVTTTGYAPSGTDARDWLAQGDEVRVIQRDTATPARVKGTVLSVSASSVSVDFDAPWTPGSSEWRLAYDSASNVDSTPPTGRRWAQTAFFFLADSGRRIGFAGGDVDAQELAP